MADPGAKAVDDKPLPQTDRRRERLTRARDVADGCCGVNPQLERRFDDAWRQSMRALNADPEAGPDA